MGALLSVQFTGDRLTGCGFYWVRVLPESPGFPCPAPWGPGKNPARGLSFGKKEFWGSKPQKPPCTAQTEHPDREQSITRNGQQLCLNAQTVFALFLKHRHLATPTPLSAPGRLRGSRFGQGPGVQGESLWRCLLGCVPPSYLPLFPFKPGINGEAGMSPARIAVSPAALRNASGSGCRVGGPELRRAAVTQ